jgi:hypothetical protein
MFLERRARRSVGGIVGGDVVKRDGKLTGDRATQALELMHATRGHLRA